MTSQIERLQRDFCSAPRAELELRAGTVTQTELWRTLPAVFLFVASRTEICNCFSFNLIIYLQLVSWKLFARSLTLISSLEARFQRPEASRGEGSL